jgi:cell fate regulator YaaT (PSP1 superfamily)
MQNPFIVGVQFEKVGKIYYFDASGYPELSVGSHVIVNTTRGSQLAKIAQVDLEPGSIKEEIKPIERPASARDLMLRQLMAEKEDQAIDIIRKYLRDAHYDGIKIASAEYSFDATRLTFYINSESDTKFNLKSFHHEISQKFPEVKVEIRQVGPRDVAKALGGIGACGLEMRCCSKYLMEFQSISIRMAKTQDISLTPSEITGICGRLRCCLLYEYEFYEEARKTLPKRKKIIQTPLGDGKVIQVLPLSQSIIVDIPEMGPRQFTNEEIETGRLIVPEPVFKVQENFKTYVELVPTSTPAESPEIKQVQVKMQKKRSSRSKRERQSKRNRR